MTPGQESDLPLELDESQDWGRLAVPQKSGYDTEVLLEAIENLDGSWGLELPSPRGPDEPALFGGRVVVRGEPRPAMQEPDFRLAPFDHPNLAKASSLVARWPEAHEQVGQIMNTLVPLYGAAIPPAERGYALGSSSYSDDRFFGVMLATVEDPLGLAQAMVQEMARCKLRALGVFSHRACRLLVNAPDERAPSPIRHDEPRPVTEVFHAVYSFIHVTALDLAMIEREEDSSTRERLVLLLARNTPRMQSGCAQVKKILRTDRPGGLFLKAFLDWADEVLARAGSILDRHGFGYPRLAG